MPHTVLHRRGFLKLSGAGACAAIAAAPLSAQATPEGVAKAIADKVGGKELKKDNRIQLTLPEIAENGGTVPVSIAVDSPMTEADHVKAVHIYADGNPLPEVASYYLGPYNGKTELSLRIRLGKTQNVVVAAEMSNGDVSYASRNIKVTLGGCGG